MTKSNPKVHFPAVQLPEPFSLGPYSITTLIPREDVERASAYRIALEPNTESKTSYHKNAEEIYYVLSGGGTAILDGKSYPLADGDLLRLQPGVRHRFLSGDEGLEMLDLHTPGVFSDHDTYWEE